jgi:hypothetical protein
LAPGCMRALHGRNLMNCLSLASSLILEKWKWAVLIVYYVVVLDAAYILTISDGSYALMASIALLAAPALVMLYGRYSSPKKPRVAPARTAVPPPPPPPETVPVRKPTVESRTEGRGVKIEGLKEIIVIKQGPPADQQYVMEVLQALHPELAGRSITVHTRTSGNFAPDEIYVITTLMLEKGKDFDIAGKTIFQQYRDKQNNQGYLVFVYE